MCAGSQPLPQAVKIHNIGLLDRDWPSEDTMVGRLGCKRETRKPSTNHAHCSDTVRASQQGGPSKAVSLYKAIKIAWRDWGMALKHPRPGNNKAASLYKAVALL